MKLLLATQNLGKQKEMQALLQDLGIEVILPASDIDVEETGETFEENAFLKAKGFSDMHDGMLTLADDSGLVVDALNGRPGVYSKRYGKDDHDRNIKLLLEMEGQEDRTAHFVCVMCLHGEGVDQCMEGKVSGTIGYEIAGESGFGFDPVFIPDGHTQTFAELGQEVKNQVSHRARALEKVKEVLSELVNADNPSHR